MKRNDIKRNIFIFVALALFIVPFFWLKPGEMDLGGDSSRIEFYDPLSSLKSFSIYSIDSSGADGLIYNQYLIPYFLFIALLKFIFESPTIVIAIINGFKFSGSFIFMFLIIQEFFRNQDKKEMNLAKFAVGMVGALFYTFSPAVVDNMKYALLTHVQVVLNPMIFYLLLRYIITRHFFYVWFAIFITIIFSSSFSLFNPSLFAFYPLALIFLLLYCAYILKKPIPWKGLAIGVMFFSSIHAFHLFPVASNALDVGSDLNNRAFESLSKINVGLEYFNAILPLGKVSEHILLPLEKSGFDWSLIIILLLTLFGLLSIRKKNKTLLLVSIFFFTTLFLVSANVTEVGVLFYRKLYSIPGFGMFRNFYGQWQWVYTFFYTLFIALAIFSFFSRVKKKYVYIFTCLVIGLIVMRSWVVFNGELIRVNQRNAKNVSVVVRMDPQYDKLLSYLKTIQNDGRIFHFPFTDFAYYILGGTNRSAYVGHSLIAYLIGKSDYPGYQNIKPYSEVFKKLSYERNYTLIKQMMSLLQVRYILYNSDELISDTNFPTFPYGYVGVPASQSALQKFVYNLAEKKVYEIGHFILLELDKEGYLPHFYAASNLFFYDKDPNYSGPYNKALSFFPEKSLDIDDPRIAFIDRETCKKILPSSVCSRKSIQLDMKDLQITFQRVNPTKYKLSIQNAKKPFLLVFQNEFNSYWTLYENPTSLTSKKISDTYFNNKIIELSPINQVVDDNPFETNGLEPLYGGTHVEVNGYANAWYVKPSGNSDGGTIDIIVEMIAQKKVYYGLVISLIGFFTFILLGAALFIKTKLLRK